MLLGKAWDQSQVRPVPGAPGTRCYSRRQRVPGTPDPRVLGTWCYLVLVLALVVVVVVVVLVVVDFVVLVIVVVFQTSEPPNLNFITGIEDIGSLNLRTQTSS